MRKNNDFSNEFDLMPRDKLLIADTAVSNEIIKLQNIIEKITYSDNTTSDEEKETICSNISRRINYLCGKRNYIRTRISVIKFKDKNKNVKSSLERRKLNLLKMAAKSVLTDENHDALMAEYDKLKEADEQCLQLRAHFNRPPA